MEGHYVGNRAGAAIKIQPFIKVEIFHCCDLNMCLHDEFYLIDCAHMINSV